MLGLLFGFHVLSCTAALEALEALPVVAQRGRVRALIDVRGLHLLPQVPDGIGWGFA